MGPVGLLGSFDPHIATTTANGLRTSRYTHVFNGIILVPCYGAQVSVTVAACERSMK